MKIIRKIMKIFYYMYVFYCMYLQHPDGNSAKVGLIK